MPATPRFKVSQTDLAVVVCIKVPHIRVGSAETHVDGTEFSFYCKPYLLRLTLPYEVGGEDDDGSCKAVYDPSDENGTITVTLKKVIPGQHFPDLDLTTTLMQPRWTPKDLLKERPSGGDEGGAEGDVPASSFSGVEVVSSERYDVHDDGDDEAAGTNGWGSSVGADGGGGSRLPAEGAGVAGTGAGAAAEARRAGGGGGGVGVEVLIRPPSYGFNDKFSGFFTSLREELREMIHLPDPENTPPEARRGLRLEHEQAAFDPDRYLGDLFAEEEDPLLTEALAFEPHWRLRLRAQQQRHRRRQRRRGQAQEQEKRNRREEEDRRQGVDGGGGGASHAGSGGGDGAPEYEALLQGVRGGVEGAVEAEAEGRGDGGQDEEEAGFTEAEQEQMRRLPNREYLIEAGSAEERRVLLGLADVLFAYAYDHRTTTSDATVESPWTVAVLSPLLSWLEAPAEGGGVAESSPVTTDASAETDVALAGIRRSLIFPYLRVWELGALVARDVRDILAAGKRCILRCLLQTYALMERGEVHYLLNKLFIEDYCVWIQKASEESLAALAERYAAAAASITKSGACLDLERIESDAERMIAAGEGGSEDEEESSTEEESSEEEDSSEESSEESSEKSSDEESSADEDGGGGGGEEKKAEAQPGGDEASGVGIGRTPATPSTQAHSSEALALPAAGHDANATADDADATALSNEAAKWGASGAASTAGSTENGSGISSSGGKHGERDPQRSITPAAAPGRTGADDDDASEPSAFRAVERNTDLLQLESLAGKAWRGGGTSSSALASKLSGLSLGEHGAPILPGGRVYVGKAVVGSPPPPPPPSSEAVGSSAGDGCSGGEEEGKGRRKKLIEEL